MITPQPLHYLEFFSTKNFPWDRLQWAPILIVLYFLIFWGLTLGFRWARRKSATIGRPSDPQNKSGFDFFFILIVAAALASRLVGIVAEPLGVLESTYLMESGAGHSLLSTIFDQIGIVNSHNPLLRVLFHLITIFTGRLEAFRLLVAVISAFAAGFAYLLGRDLISRQSGLLLGALFAFSPYQTFYGRSALPYGVLVFFALAAVWVYITNRSMILLAILTALGTYTHLGFFAVAITIIFHAIIYRDANANDEPAKRHARLYKTLQSMFLAGLFYYPWVSVNIFYKIFLHDQFLAMHRYGDFVPGPDRFFEALPQFLSLLGRLFIGVKISGMFLGILLLFFLLAINFILAITKRFDLFALCAGSFIFALFGLGWTMAFQFDGRLLLIDRYFVVAHPFLLLGAIAVLIQFFNRFSRSGKTIVFSFWIAVSIWSCFQHVIHKNNADIPKVVSEIVSHAYTGDAIAVLPAAFYGDVVDYYFPENKTVSATWWNNCRAASWRKLPNGSEIFAVIRNFHLPFSEAISKRRVKRLWIVWDRELSFGHDEANSSPALQLIQKLEKKYRCIINPISSVRDVESYLFEIDTKPDLVKGETFRLDFGTDDYPFVYGFAPNEEIRAAFRIPSTSNARVNLIIGQGCRALRFKLIASADNDAVLPVNIRWAGDESESKFIFKKGFSIIKFNVNANQEQPQLPFTMKIDKPNLYIRLISLEAKAE